MQDQVGWNASKTAGVNNQQSTSHTKSEGKSVSWNSGNNSSKSQTDSFGHTKNQSQGTTTNSGQTSTQGDSESSSESIQNTYSVQYPQALHAIVTQCNACDRSMRAIDPFVMLVFRVADPALILSSATKVTTKTL